MKGPVVRLRVTVVRLHLMVDDACTSELVNPGSTALWTTVDSPGISTVSIVVTGGFSATGPYAYTLPINRDAPTAVTSRANTIRSIDCHMAIPFGSARQENRR